jgi:hypothetical protein
MATNGIPVIQNVVKISHRVQGGEKEHKYAENMMSLARFLPYERKSNEKYLG